MGVFASRDTGEPFSRDDLQRGSIKAHWLGEPVAPPTIASDVGYMRSSPTTSHVGAIIKRRASAAGSAPGVPAMGTAGDIGNIAPRRSEVSG
jgi:hypothetical protein